MNYLEESGKWLGLEKDDIIDESVVKFFSSYTARELKLAAAREYIHHAHNFTRDKNMERKLRGYIKASDKQINCLKKELLKFENGDDRYKEKVIKDFIKYENKKWDKYSIKKWYNHQIDFYTGEKKVFESSLKSYLKYKNNMNEATYMNEGLFKKSKTIDPKIEPKAAISKAIALIKKYSRKYTDIKNISDAKYDILNQQKNKETFYTDFINNKEDQIDLILYDIEAKYEDRNQIINLIDKQLIPDVNYELNKVGYSVEITDINGPEVIIDLVKGATINESYNFKTEGISMNTINKLVSLSESYNIKNSDRLRNDIVSEYTETINSLDSIDESVIVKDIRVLPIYKINEKKKAMKESYAVDLDSLKYIVQNEQCSLEEASNLLKRINNIDEDCSLYCVLPKNINENMSIESFINLNNMLNEAGIIPIAVNEKGLNYKAWKAVGKAYEYSDRYKSNMIPSSIDLIKNAIDNPTKTGKFENLRPRLLKMVDKCKTIDDVNYLKRDIRAGKIQLTNLKQDRPEIAKQIDDHIKWLETDYMKALNDKAKELKAKK